MPDIIKEIIKVLPQENISDASYEGANIVFYTKNKEYFLDNKGTIRNAVQTFKKRIELRPDPSMCMLEEDAKKVIMEMIPSDAGVVQCLFDTHRSEVIIEAEKPGIAIGKQGEILRAIREKCMWVPLVRRTAAIKSDIVDNIRKVLFQHSDYRRKFLDKVGHRIYDGWIRDKKSEWIRVTYLGAARQVGRSCLFLQTPESRVLLDCGLDAGDDANAYPYLEVPEFNIKELDAVVVSHSHIDHCAMVPYLFKFGYRGPVYCTPPTRDVMALLMLDFVKIQRSEGKEPIYTQDDIKEMVKHTITLDYEEVTDITPDLRLTLYDSGHILGSAMVHLHVGNGFHNLLYTGDMKFGKTHLLAPAVTMFPRLETLMIESTYGGKSNVFPSEKDQTDYLKKIVKDTVERGGKILMPTLGSGRGQEIMILVEEMVRAGELPQIPVFIDGLILDITAIYTAYPEYLNSAVRKRIFHKDDNPFLSTIFKHVGSQKERKQIVEETGPCIILATSGMLTGGPSVQYLRQLADNSRNSLVFTCYQGEGTLGRRLQGGEREIVFREGQKEEVVPIKMDVHRIEISSHSDRRQLMNFIAHCQPKPKRVIINHGENTRCLDLASSIHKQFRIETAAPRNLEAIRIR